MFPNLDVIFHEYYYIMTIYRSTLPQIFTFFLNLFHDIWMGLHTRSNHWKGFVAYCICITWVFFPCIWAVRGECLMLSELHEWLDHIQSKGVIGCDECCCSLWKVASWDSGAWSARVTSPLLVLWSVKVFSLSHILLLVQLWTGCSLWPRHKAQAEWAGLLKFFETLWLHWWLGWLGDQE